MLLNFIFKITNIDTTGTYSGTYHANALNAYSSSKSGSNNVVLDPTVSYDNSTGIVTISNTTGSKYSNVDGSLVSVSGNCTVTAIGNLYYMAGTNFNV